MVLVVAAVGLVVVGALVLTIAVVLSPDRRRRRDQRRRKRRYLRQGMSHLQEPRSGDSWSGGGPDVTP